MEYKELRTALTLPLRKTEPTTSITIKGSSVTVCLTSQTSTTASVKTFVATMLLWT